MTKHSDVMSGKQFVAVHDAGQTFTWEILDVWRDWVASKSIDSPSPIYKTWPRFIVQGIMELNNNNNHQPLKIGDLIHHDLRTYRIGLIINNDDKVWLLPVNDAYPPFFMDYRDALMHRFNPRFVNRPSGSR